MTNQLLLCSICRTHYTPVATATIEDKITVLGFHAAVNICAACVVKHDVPLPDDVNDVTISYQPELIPSGQYTHDTPHTIIPSGQYSHSRRNRNSP